MLHKKFVTIDVTTFLFFLKILFIGIIMKQITEHS